MSTVIAARPIQLPPDQRQSCRARRVMLLLSALVVFGLGDLALTLTHAFSIGMHEVNPIGAYLIQSDSTLGLTLFKLGTIGVTVGLLLKTRHRPFAELASWMLVAVMVSLTVHWYNYNHDVTHEIAVSGYPDQTPPLRLSLAEVEADASDVAH